MFYLLHFFLFYCINYVGSINQLMSIIVYVLRKISFVTQSKVLMVQMFGTTTGCVKTFSQLVFCTLV